MSFASEYRWSDVVIAAVARGVSVCGDFLAATALLLALQQRGAGSYAVAALLLAAAVPPVVLVRWAGRLADRLDSRLVLVVTGVAQVAVCLAMVFVSNSIALIALVAVLACGFAVTQPTLSALTPAMVRRDDLARASALGQTAGSVGLLIAPALAGVLVGQFGLRVPLLFDAASYLAIVVAGLALRTRRVAGAVADRSAADPAPEQGTVAGWRMRDDRPMWTMVVLTGAVIAAVSAVNVAEVFFVRGVLHSTTTVYGLLSAAWTGTMLIGAWLLTRRPPSATALSWAMIAALLVTCVDLLGVSVVPNIGVLVPLYVIGGVSNGVENVAAGLTISMRTPAAFRGRAFALYGAVANGANAAGFLLGGVVLGLLSVRLTVAATGLFGLVVTLIFSVPLLRAAARERVAASTAATVPVPAGTPADVVA
jgi:MFS family permease